MGYPESNGCLVWCWHSCYLNSSQGRHTLLSLSVKVFWSWECDECVTSWRVNTSVADRGARRSRDSGRVAAVGRNQWSGRWGCSCRVQSSRCSPSSPQDALLGDCQANRQTLRYDTICTPCHCPPSWMSQGRWSLQAGEAQHISSCSSCRDDRRMIGQDNFVSTGD